MNRSWSELTASEICHGTRIAVKTTTPGGVDQVKHPDSFVVVQILVQYIPPCSTHHLNGRMIIYKIVKVF
jgi:hypothetical protein